MEQRVLVQRCEPDGTAQVVHIRESACSGDCHKCTGCGAAQERLTFTAQNPIGAKPGDVVRVESASGPVLAAAAVLYVVPVVLFLVGYLLGQTQWGNGPLVSLLAFGLGIALAVLYDRKVARKQKTVYTITGFWK